jgi:hypothetical protein
MITFQSPKACFHQL